MQGQERQRNCIRREVRDLDRKVRESRMLAQGGSSVVGTAPGPIKWSVMPHGQQLSDMKDTRKD